MLIVMELIHIFFLKCPSTVYVHTVNQCYDSHWTWSDRHCRLEKLTHYLHVYKVNIILLHHEVTKAMSSKMVNLFFSKFINVVALLLFIEVNLKFLFWTIWITLSVQQISGHFCFSQMMFDIISLQPSLPVYKLIEMAEWVLYVLNCDMYTRSINFEAKNTEICQMFMGDWRLVKWS